MHTTSLATTSIRRFAVSCALATGLLGSSLTAATVLNENFAYDDVSALLGNWTVAYGPNPGLILVDGGPDKAVSLNNRGLYRDLSSPVNADFTLTVSMAHNAPEGSNRNAYVLITGAPVEGAVSGYGFLWASGSTGNGTISLRKFEDISAFTTSPPAPLAWDDGAGLTEPSAGIITRGTTPTLSSHFSTFSLSWVASTNTLSLTNALGSVVLTEVDNDFSSFSRVYISGNATSYYDSISLTAIPEPSSFAALAGLGGLAVVGLRRRRRCV